MQALVGVCAVIDRINDKVGTFVSWTTLLLVAVTFIDVVMRYTMNVSFVFTQELEWHLFAFIFLIGAGYTLKEEGHVRVEVFYGRLGPKGQAWINIVGVIFFLIPSCYMFIRTGIPFVKASFAVMEGSPDPGGIPFRFILKSCIPVGYALLLIQGISLGIKSILTLIGYQAQTEGA